MGLPLVLCRILMRSSLGGDPHPPWKVKSLPTVTSGLNLKGLWGMTESLFILLQIVNNNIGGQSPPFVLILTDCFVSIKDSPYLANFLLGRKSFLSFAAVWGRRMCRSPFFPVVLSLISSARQKYYSITLLRSIQLLFSRALFTRLYATNK